MQVHYTYVWGGQGDKGGPILFTDKASRTKAIRNSSVGDILFGVVSTNPNNPDVKIPNTDKGRIVCAWQISHYPANTLDYGINANHRWENTYEGTYRWPFALQPIRVWKILNAPIFRELSGYTNTTHTQRAVTSFQEVNDTLANSMRAALNQTGRELELMPHKFVTIQAALTKLRQKHPYPGQDHQTKRNPDKDNFIYIATLGSNSKTIKIGHSQDSVKRVSDFNKFRLSNEPQWELYANQLIGSVKEAIQVEKQLGKIYNDYRTEKNNGEVYIGVRAFDVLTSLGTLKNTQ